MSRNSLKIVLADDHSIVREGIKALVNEQLDMQVVGEAADSEAAYRVAREREPDVVVLDLSMPPGGGAEATKRIRTDCPRVNVLALTVHEEPLYLTKLLAAGASGYVLKRAAATDLLRAIRVVAAGGVYLDPAIAGALVPGFLETEQIGDGVPDDGLSDREREVLVRVAQGFSNKEIAAALQLSVKTVESYKARVADKLRLHSRVDIVRYAAARGWLGND